MLAAKKAQGVKLGGLNAKGIANRQEALERAEQLRPLFAFRAGFSFRRASAPRMGSPRAIVPSYWKARVWRHRTPTRVSYPQGDAPALFLLANTLVCSQSPLVGASRSRISLGEAAGFAGILWRVGALGRRAGSWRRARPQEGVGAGEALSLSFRRCQAESPCTPA